MLGLARQHQIAPVPVNSYVFYRDAANPRGWNAGFVVRDMVQTNQTIEVAPLRFSGTTESLLEAFRDAPKKPWAHFHNSVHNFAVEGGKPQPRRGSGQGAGSGSASHRQSVATGGGADAAAAAAAAATPGGGGGRHRKSVATSSGGGTGRRRNRGGAAAAEGQNQEPQGGKGNFIDEVDVGLCPAGVLRQTQILEALKRHALPAASAGDEGDSASATSHAIKTAVSKPVSYFQTLPDVLIFESAHHRSAVPPPAPPPQTQTRVVGFADEDGAAGHEAPRPPPPPTRIRLNVFKSVLLVHVPATELKVVLGVTSGQAAAIQQQQQQRGNPFRASLARGGGGRHASIASNTARANVSPTDCASTPTQDNAAMTPQPPLHDTPKQPGGRRGGNTGSGGNRNRQRSVFGMQSAVSPIDEDAAADGTQDHANNRTPSLTPSSSGVPVESRKGTRRGGDNGSNGGGERVDVSLEVEGCHRASATGGPQQPPSHCKPSAEAASLLEIVQGTALGGEMPDGVVVGAGRPNRIRRERSARMDGSSISPSGGPRTSPGRLASFVSSGPTSAANQPPVAPVVDYVAFDRSMLEVLPSLLHTQHVAEEAEAVAAQLLEPTPRYHAQLKCLTIPRLNSHWLNFCRDSDPDMSKSTLLMDSIRPVAGSNNTTGTSGGATPSTLPPPQRIATVLASFFPADVSDDMMEDFAMTIATHWNAMSRLSFSMVQHPFLSPTAMELTFELKRPVKQADGKVDVELEKREKQDHLVAEDAIPSISKKGISYVMSAIAFRLSRSPHKPLPPPPSASSGAMPSLTGTESGGGAATATPSAVSLDGMLTPPRRGAHNLLVTPPAALAVGPASPGNVGSCNTSDYGEEALLSGSNTNKNNTPRNETDSAMTSPRIVTFECPPYAKQGAALCPFTSPTTVSLTLPPAVSFSVVPLQHIELCFLKLEDGDLMGRGGEGSVFFDAMRQALPWLATLSLRGNFLTDASLTRIVNLWTADAEERARRERLLLSQRRRSRKASARMSASGLLGAVPGHAPPLGNTHSPHGVGGGGRGVGMPEPVADDAAGGRPMGDVVAIRRLDLSLNRIGDAGAFGLSNALENGCVAPSLSLVNLEGNAISKEIKDNVLAGLFVPQLAPAWTMPRHLRCERSVRRRVMVLAYAMLALRDRRSVIAAASMSFSLSNNEAANTTSVADPFLSPDLTALSLPTTTSSSGGFAGGASVSLGRVSIPFLTYAIDPTSTRRKRAAQGSSCTAVDGLGAGRRPSEPFGGVDEGPAIPGEAEGDSVSPVPSPRTRKSVVNITVDLSSFRPRQNASPTHSPPQGQDTAADDGYSSSDCDDNGVPLLLSPTANNNRSAPFPTVAIFRRMSHRELSSVARLHRARMVETERRRELGEQESLIGAVAQYLTMFERTQPLTVLF